MPCIKALAGLSVRPGNSARRGTAGVRIGIAFTRLGQNQFPFAIDLRLQRGEPTFDIGGGFART
jgi:inner membrane protein involved in colicin E2 resistance